MSFLQETRLKYKDSDMLKDREIYVMLKLIKN